MYIYPVDSSKIPKDVQLNPKEKLFNLSNYKPSDLNIHLYKHLMTSGYIEELTNFNPDLAIWDSQSCEELKAKDEKAWKELLACAI